MEDYIILKTDKQSVEKKQILLCKTLLSKYLNLQKEHKKPQLMHIEKLERLQKQISEFKPRKVKEIPILKLEIPKPQIKETPMLNLEVPEPLKLPLLKPLKLPPPESLKLPRPEPLNLPIRPILEEEIPLIKSETKNFSSELSEGNLEKQGDTYTYKVKEPEINQEVLDRVEENLSSKLEKDPSIVTNSKFIKNEIIKAFKQLRENYTLEDIYNIRYYLIRNYIGLGKIEPLLCDKNITSVQLDGVNKSITVMYKPLNKKIETNIIFKTKDEINSFIELLAKKTNQELSEENSVLNTSLNDLKIQAILSTGVLEPKFTVSKVSS